MRVCFGFAAAAVLTIAGLAQATPIDKKQVAADAKWAAHLDVDALMASKSMQKVREQILKDNPNAESGLAMLRTVWRFDPTKDLHGITLYSTQLKKDTGAAVIRAKVDKQFLLELTKALPEYKTEKYGKYDVHSWFKDGKRHNATFFQDDVLVFSPVLDDLKAALDVLDGTKPNLAASGSQTELPQGTILSAFANDLGNADLHLKSPLSKQIDTVRVVVGETQGELFVRGQLTVKDAEIAKKIKAVADGALSFASLAKIDDAEATKLINAVKVSLADKTISLDAQAPVDDVWTLLQKEHAKKTAELKLGHDEMRKRIHKRLLGK